MFVQWKKIKKSLGDFTLNFNLNINKGELVTLLGPSGCGKTTALRIASGLIQPDSGEFILDDRKLTNVDPSKRNIGIVFQNYALFPHMSVEENIGYGLKNRGFKGNNLKDEVNYILDKLHLSNYNKRDINSLSGGEKQRVALGRSLAIKPKLLLLDEPLSALDAELRKRLRKEIREIQKEFSITTLYVTHDQEEALSVSDRVALLNSGELQQFSTPYEIYHRPKNIFTAKFIGESNIVNVEGERLFFRPEMLSPGNREGFINFSGEIVEQEYLGYITRGIVKTSCGNYLNVISKDQDLKTNYSISKKNIMKI